MYPINENLEWGETKFENDENEVWVIIKYDSCFMKKILGNIKGT